jgi:hypothetical protein
MRKPLPPEKIAALPRVPSVGMSAVEFAARAPERARYVKSLGPKVRERLAQEIQRHIATNDWRGAGAQHLVALYCECHEQVYGVRATELDQGREFAFAANEATGLVSREFDDKIERAVEYVRWVWVRERSREAWRIREGKPGGRIGWKLMFSSRMVTDFRVELAREGKAVR